jgi:spore photoproduct lyase
VTGTRVLDVRTIYAEPGALALERGQQVVARHPAARVVEVPSATRIEAVHGDAANVDRWVRVKTEVLALGVRKSLTARRNERPANWIAPSTASGCAYCYVPRHKGYANPITV